MNNLRKTCIAILLLVFSGSAFADIIHCKGKYTSFDKKKLPIQIDIVIPEKVSVGISLWSLENNPSRVLGPPIGEGLIEISSASHAKKRYEFLATQMPRAGYSLVGFYFHHDHVSTLRADLWAPDMPFFFYDSWTNDFITGNCGK